MIAQIYAIISVILVSFISLIGIITIFMKERKIERTLLYFVSFAAGAFFGDVFFHLLPESIKNGFSLSVSISILGGIIIFFVVEKIIRWRHCHIPISKEHKHPLSIMILIGDGMHNFIDGIIIGASYLVDIKTGIATTLAVIFHEIPQEIGDFSALLYGGFTKIRALLFNFLSALTALAGTLLVLFLNSYIELTYYLIPFTIGSFIYIAGSDLIPELHKELEIKKTIMQLLFFVTGIMTMFLLIYLEV